jgi:hypothetical protein
MELTIKNDDLGAVIERVLAEGDKAPVFEGRTPEQNGQYMVVTYALDILRNGWSLGKELQFTYKDLADLPVVAAACYRTYRQRESVTYSAQGTAKSLAAYFFVLAWNEQDLPCEVRTKPVLIYPVKGPDFGSWINFTIRLKGEDFLRAINDGMRIIRADDGKRFVSYDLNPLMEAYQKATGVDLAEKGLVNIVFDR